MNSIKYILWGLLIVIMFACNKDWKDHYSSGLETINTSVWDSIQKDSSLSIYVYYMKKYNIDTLFQSERVYTLFIPNNSAFAQYKDSAEITRAILKYNISEHFILSQNIEGLKKIQTLGEKYALFNRIEYDNYTLDDIPIIHESPLFVNGKYFVMNTIAYPKLNLYEYIASNNPVLKDYIDNLDTLILDLTKSQPIGFDDLGRTIYDTVAILSNMFEREFFPIKHESRYKTATIVFPKAADYYAGLDIMAQKLGGTFIDHNNIPLVWQNKYLIPYLLKFGVFENMLEENEFVLNPARNDTLRLKNILGDSVDINYNVDEKTLCSNGYAYNYLDFKVPDTLWKSTQRFFAKTLVNHIGIDRWTWKDLVAVSNNSYSPLLDKISNTLEDSSLRVMFPKSPGSKYYLGTYTCEFNVDNLFPRKYLMIVNTNPGFGGKYRVYVNNVLVKTIDYTSFSRGFYASVIAPKRYVLTNNFISFDCWVNSIAEYGKAKIKFEYYGYSTDPTVTNSALSINYIDFKPY